jgi:hypothetical protein
LINLNRNTIKNKDAVSINIEEVFGNFVDAFEKNDDSRCFGLKQAFINQQNMHTSICDNGTA